MLVFQQEPRKMQSSWLRSRTLLIQQSQFNTSYSRFTVMIKMVIKTSDSSFICLKQTQVGGEGQTLWANDKRRLSRWEKRKFHRTDILLYDRVQLVCNKRVLWFVRWRDRRTVPGWLHPEDYWQKERNTCAQRKRWWRKRQLISYPPSSKPRWGMVTSDSFIINR